MSEKRLKDRVALVTGASRGGGKGIALVLGEEGAVVYVTGRSVRGEPTTLGRPGTIDDTAEELTARGGTGIAVRCDHTDDSQVETLFERIRSERGHLDLLVNNAWSGYELPLYYETPFWEMEWRHWDLMFQGGLRAAAFASMLAAPPMIEAGRGLIVNITWVLDRPHGVTFYEVVKNATNKLTEQMADDLRPRRRHADRERASEAARASHTCNHVVLRHPAPLAQGSFRNAGAGQRLPWEGASRARQRTIVGAPRCP